ncbi:hypothetical protein BDZ91DRAFT_767484 [Kalaharituber pfeilii]|nr:hypothetical protein BDZ91DRAFT_767484 [Kalaharituber pfeilii]
MTPVTSISTYTLGGTAIVEAPSTFTHALLPSTSTPETPLTGIGTIYVPDTYSGTNIAFGISAAHNTVIVVLEEVPGACITSAMINPAAPIDPTSIKCDYATGICSEITLNDSTQEDEEEKPPKVLVLKVHATDQVESTIQRLLFEFQRIVQEHEARSDDFAMFEDNTGRSNEEPSEGDRELKLARKAGMKAAKEDATRSDRKCDKEKFKRLHGPGSPASSLKPDRRTKRSDMEGGGSRSGVDRELLK